MLKQRESTLTARVFNVNSGPRDRRGWYYEIEGEQPEGPYPTEIAAGKVAREVIVRSATPTPDVAGEDDLDMPTKCPVCDCSFRVNLARDVRLTAIGPDSARVHCGHCGAALPVWRKEAVAYAVSQAGSDADADPFTGEVINRRTVDRRVAEDGHFAGSDRRMKRTDRRVEHAIASRDRLPDFAEVDDQPLDRTGGRNKYAVINMRKVMPIAAGIDGTSQRGADVVNALNVLRRAGVLNDGAAKTEGEFFVLMLKDEFAGAALLTYANNARHAGMVTYAADVLQLALRAGRGSPWCKRPD